MTPLEALFEIRNIVDKTGKMDFDEIVKLVEEKFTSTNTGSPKSICDGCLNKQCTMPERVCYKIVVSECSGYK